LGANKRYVEGTDRINRKQKDRNKSLTFEIGLKEKEKET